MQLCTRVSVRGSVRPLCARPAQYLVELHQPESWGYVMFDTREGEPAGWSLLAAGCWLVLRLGQSNSRAQMGPHNSVAAVDGGPLCFRRSTGGWISPRGSLAP